MASESRRERFDYQGQIVTLIHRGKIQSEIRDQFGYVKTVPTRKLKSLPDDHPQKWLVIRED